MDDFHFISPSPIICCIAGLTPDNHSLTSSIDNQCKVSAQDRLVEARQRSFSEYFASISIGNIIGVLSTQKRTRLMTQRKAILTSVILLLLSFQVLVLVIL